jgi:hypothetical protein
MLFEKFVVIRKLRVMIDESKRGKGVSEEKYEESRNVEESERDESMSELSQNLIFLFCHFFLAAGCVC